MIWEEKLYVSYGSFTMMIIWRRRSVWRSSRWRRRPSARIRRRGRRAAMKKLEKRASSCVDRFSKILFVLFRCRITEDDGFEDLLFRSQMHVDDRDEVALVAQQRRMWKTRCVGGSWLFIVATSVAVVRIYMEDPPRVTMSCNWLCLSLSKRIRHRLISKINNKKRSWTCEALGQISVDYSCAHRLTSPCHARSGPARQGEWACACVSPSLLSFTYL
jgi:hypothetical protein